jgi:CBS domain-containing protein
MMLLMQARALDLDDLGSAAPGGQEQHLHLLSEPLSGLRWREPVTVPPTASVREAAQLMQDRRVSSVLVVEQGRLFGLVTDRDLRNRVVAAGLDTARPVMDIATLAPLTLDERRPAIEALMLMARHNVHHLPLIDGERVTGLVTARDLTERHGTSAVYLVGEVHKQPDLEGLVRVCRRLPELQRHLAAADASAHATGHLITAVTDAVTARLLQLAENRLGPPPVDYAWVAAGSQARCEQTAKTDQDNCLVLDDAYDEARHGAYFEALSRSVCDGLNACGYVHCPGEMMAMTPAWRQPWSRWRQYFHQWIDEPEPKALMLTCVFFDLRLVHGRAELLDSLRRDMLERTRGNGIFLAYMVGNALAHRPPRGLFGGISPIRSGEHRGAIDLKHTGIVPIVDLARIYALAGALEDVNTQDRLQRAADSGEISVDGVRDLRQALEFLAAMRIRHQARQMAQGQAPDNFLVVDSLSNFERSQLKDAFGVVHTLQSVLEQRFQAGRF